MCGDSKTNSNKKRGYIYLKDDSYRFHCHNCGADKDFKWFLRDIDNDLYNDFRKESAWNAFSGPKHEDTIDTSIFKQTRRPRPPKHQKYMVPLDSTDENNPGRKYLLERGVNEKALNKVLWTEHYDKAISELFGDKYEGRSIPTTGIVFPVYANISGTDTIIGYQLRSVDKNVSKAHRFITCMSDGYNAMFGLKDINFTKQVYVVEGPIDSLFIPNCVAVLTSTLWKADIPNAVYINDCEPRNTQVSKQVKKCIDKGLSVVMLPMKYNGMDVNDIVKKFKYTTDELLTLFKKYTYKGLKAEVAFAQWVK